MTDNDPRDQDASDQPDDSHRHKSVTDDPAATDHPTGEKQAAENAEDEPVA
jgi:hypothetical protein